MQKGNLAHAIEAEKCRRDAHFFVFEKVITKDEHDLDNAEKPFPGHLYLHALLDCLLVSGKLVKPKDARYALEAGLSREWLDTIHQSGILFLEKSRQILASWLICAYLLWRAKHRKHQLILAQSKKEDDAANLVYNKEPFNARISFMESKLPRHLRSCVFPTNGSKCHIFFPNGSHIWGIPEGGDIVRSNTASVIFSDEAAFQPEFGSAYTAALPSIKGGGQLIAVSSAEPGEFCDLVEGLEEVKR